AWRLANGVPIHSVALERLDVEFVPQWPYRRRSLLFYDWMVRDFFFWAAHQGGRQLPLPGTGADFAVGDAWVFEAEAAFAFARRAGRLDSLGRTAEAADHWCRIFGQPLELMLGRPPAPAAAAGAGDTLPAAPPAGRPLIW
ncbi:MAG: hypothetical protein H6906_15450, partial [Hyphomicrobiales bacterium]|nr:hypothetical protein [Hyphomicrobiales bacterium]